MNRIKLLDNETVKQIAAGEVIDSPSAVIKELIENSMDAEAKNITVEIKNGGKSYIRITDDGLGINSEDIAIAFKRHSTSKLKKADDLYNIGSFGFRGEALASIAAVSKVELITKTRDEDGSQTFLENADIVKTIKAACPNGTTIIIEDIFYNLPVRRNFLKSDNIESNKITDIVTNLALGNPSISFKYIKDGKVIFKSPGNSELLDTIYTILGREFRSNLIEVDYKDELIGVKGYISNNSFYRSNRNHQYLYVNKRYIKNDSIRSTIESIYRSIIPINRFPIYLLFIEIRPDYIDVNIHPTKQEIKFINENKVYNSIINCISPILNESLEVYKPETKKETSPSKEELPRLYETTFFKDKKTEEADRIKESSLIEPVSRKPLIKPAREVPLESLSKDLPDLEDNHFQEVNPIEDGENLSNIKLSISPDQEKRSKSIDILKNINLLGVVFDTYIVAEDRLSDNMVLIDQHAAHERIMYEKLVEEYNSENVPMQLLMTPEVIELSHGEMEVFTDNIDLFRKIGFDLDIFGESSLIIRGVPLVFGNPEVKKLFYEILDNLHLNIRSPYEVKIEKIMKLSCTKAIKSGDSISKLEIKELIDLLMASKLPYTCPHGRPTVIVLDRKDIEKLFKRIM